MSYTLTVTACCDTEGCKASLSAKSPNRVLGDLVRANTVLTTRLSQEGWLIVDAPGARAQKESRKLYCPAHAKTFQPPAPVSKTPHLRVVK